MTAKRRARVIPDVLTDDERRALLAQPGRRYPTGLRNYCILRLMLNTGLRNSEVCDMQVSDLDFTSGRLKVRGKGRKQRILWLADDDLEWLKRWMERRAELPGARGPLLSTLKGGRVSPRYLQQMVKRMVARAGIEKDIHPHSLRHTFATDLYRKTKNLRITQKALGHSNIATTEIYTHIVDDELENALKSLRED